MSTPPARTPASDPFSPGVQRLAASSGIVFAVLLIVTIALSSAETPDFDAPLREWTEYADDNEEKIRIAALVMGVAAFEFLWFLGHVRSFLGRVEDGARGFTRLGYIVLAGGIVGIAGLALGVFLGAAALSHGADSDPELVRGLNQMSGGAFGLVSVGFGTMLYTAAFTILRLGGLPRWLGWLSLVGGLCFLLQLGTLLSEEYDNAFGVFYPLGFLALVVWCVVASLDFMRRVGDAD